MTAEQMNGAEIVIRALSDQGVDVVFGYPGGAVLPIYDALFKQNRLRHILVRHEQGAVHAAEGYARSTGKVGVVLRHQRPGRDQHGNRSHRRADGFGAARLPDRPGAHPSHRQRRVPGGRHHRHHAALHQAQLSGQGRERAGARDARGLLCRANRPARPGRCRSAEGRAVRDRDLSSARDGAASANPTARRPIPIRRGSPRRQR